MKEQLLHIRYEEVETGEIYALDIWDRTDDDVWNLIDAYDGANGTSFFQEIERILDVTVIDTRYTVDVKREKDGVVRRFNLGADYHYVEDIIEHPDFKDDMWQVFLADVSDSIYELYKDWKEVLDEIVWDDLDEMGYSHAFSGYKITQAEEETEEET